jgi:hypothetical protein
MIVGSAIQKFPIFVRSELRQEERAVRGEQISGVRYEPED